MKTRIQIFEDLKTHPWLSRLYKNLSEYELGLIFDFCSMHASKNKDEFEFILNRLYLDDYEKTKNYKKIKEILSNINSIFKEE